MKGCEWESFGGDRTGEPAVGLPIGGEGFALRRLAFVQQEMRLGCLVVKAGRVFLLAKRVRDA